MRDIIDQLIKTQQVDILVALIIVILLIIVALLVLIYKPLCKLLVGVGELLEAIVSIVIRILLYGVCFLLFGAFIIFMIILGIILSPVALIIYLSKVFFNIIKYF